jgi:hypothetical protein
MVKIREHLDLIGRSPFAEWFDRLNSPAAAKVTTALVRLEQGNFSMPEAWVQAYMNAGSISDLATECISGRMGKRL